MKTRTAQEIRSMFLKYFENRNHAVVESASLIPKNDPSLLFVNAGMVPFKDVFLGRESRDYLSATSSQACLRVGGKHNDFNQVGYTSRHHTFFEMLGNFSFGGYFKKEAIAMAWEFITVELGIPVDRLWVSVYQDDDETFALWRDMIGINEDRIRRCGEADNFWSMGDVGPCGPCTEIFYDHGPAFEGGPPGSENQDGQRYMEIWNIVFMQYDRRADGTSVPLDVPCVDTGMGLERISAVIQGVSDTYCIDLFDNIIGVIAEGKMDSMPFHVKKILADHLRASIMLIADGIQPGSVGRNYVLRRLIRRALRYAYQTGIALPCLSGWSDRLIDLLSDARPGLIEKKAHIREVLRKEELQFSSTLKHGIGLLEDALVDVEPGSIIDGVLAFKLYDTFGFPIDVTQDILAERGLSLDVAGFEKEMERQKAMSRADSNFKALPKGEQLGLPVTTFLGYEQLVCTGNIMACYQLQETQWISIPFVDATTSNAYVVLNQTVFYAEGGGQVGDKGRLECAAFEAIVQDTQSISGVIVHQIVIERGECFVGSEVVASVDRARQQIRLHHTATHLLHAALHNVLGSDALQKGSWVDDKRLRFDFSCSNALTSDQLTLIEQWVNRSILDDLPVLTEEMSPVEATAGGALGLFEDQYQKLVRVVSVGTVSKELCGGTHARRTGELAGFIITSSSSVSSGVRRIEAIVGHAIVNRSRQLETIRQKMMLQLQCSEEQLIDKLSEALKACQSANEKLSVLRFEKHLDALNAQLAIVKPGETAVFQFDVDQSQLLTLADHAKKTHQAWAVLLGQGSESSLPIVCVNIAADAQASELFAGRLRQISPLKAGIKPGLIRGVMSTSLAVDALKEALARD